MYFLASPNRTGPMGSLHVGLLTPDGGKPIPMFINRNDLYLTNSDIPTTFSHRCFFFFRHRLSFLTLGIFWTMDEKILPFYFFREKKLDDDLLYKMTIDKLFFNFFDIKIWTTISFIMLQHIFRQLFFPRIPFFYFPSFWTLDDFFFPDRGKFGRRTIGTRVWGGGNHLWFSGATLTIMCTIQCTYI